MIDYKFLSHILNTEQKILHLKDKDEQRFDQYLQYSEYITIGVDNDSDVAVEDIYNDNLLNYIDFVPDTLLLSEILEKSENPFDLIRSHKRSADQIVIYEFKYDEMSAVPDNWKTHWKTVGLTNFLYGEFDWINEVFLNGLTVFTCKEPRNEQEKKIDR